MHTLHARSFLSLPIALSIVIAALGAAGCAQNAAAPPPAAMSAEGSFDEAVDAAIDVVFGPTPAAPGDIPAVLAAIQSTLQSKLAPAIRRSVLVEPVIEAGSGNQTEATQAIDARIAERVASRFPNVELLPYQAANLARAQYLLTGSMARAASTSGYRIDLALTEMKTRSISAQASSRARAEGVDTTPTAYYRDSPVLLRDNAVEQIESTSRAPRGNAAPAGHLERIPAATLLADAIAAYNGDRPEQALDLYSRALATPGGDQIRVHNGIYLANWRLGRAPEAEQAFSRIVAYGIANRSLGVKFLFKTNSTDFWPDPRISAPYEFWLRQIARQAATSLVCLQIVGHTSRTGSAEYNDQLSQRRALFIRQRLEAESAELAPRLRASGMGFRENLVGSGTDDIRDALDRRVEFKVIACS